MQVYVVYSIIIIPAAKPAFGGQLAGFAPNLGGGGVRGAWGISGQIGSGTDPEGAGPMQTNGTLTALL